MTKNESLQKAWPLYEATHGHVPNSTRQAYAWAVSQGILKLPPIDPLDVGAEQMAQALRAEIKTDQYGRKYRVNHAVRATKAGVQYTFWGVLGFAEHGHMERSFSQRREQVVGDCTQLKTDVDVYNDLSQRPKIQCVLDFTEDVAEREALSMLRSSRHKKVA